MKKRGMSNILTSVLLVLLALAAIVIIWVFIAPLFSKGDIDISSLKVGVNIVPGSVKLSETSLNFSVKREAGNNVNFTGLRVVVWDIDGNNRVWLFEGGNYVLDEFESVRVEINDLAFLGWLEKIEVIPLILDNKGNSVPAVGSDEHVVSEDEIVNPPGEPGAELLFDGSSCTTGVQCYSGICLPASSGPDLEMKCQPSTGYRVFVTSRVFRGEFNQVGSSVERLSGGDDKCRALGSANTRGTDWKAWLSNDTLNATDRLYHSPVNYTRIDDVIVANDWSDLINGSIQNPINIDETGNIPDTSPVWTGTDQYGSSKIGYDCGDWFASDSSGYYGVMNSVSATWTDGSFFGCASSLHLYCFEQPSMCTSDNDGTNCDNKNLCDNNNDICSNGECVGQGTPIDCDDSNSCTDDSCNPVEGVCSSVNVSAGEERSGCSGANVCNGDGSCIPSGICGDGVTGWDTNTRVEEECDDGNSVPGDGCTNCLLDEELTSCKTSGWESNRYYYLSGPVISADEDCFDISAADNVTLNCEGNSITATAGSSAVKIGVDIHPNGVEVRDCVIVAEDSAIKVSSGTGHLIIGNSITPNTKKGIKILTGDNEISGNVICGGTAGKNGLIIMSGAGIQTTTASNTCDIGNCTDNVLGTGSNVCNIVSGTVGDCPIACP